MTIATGYNFWPKTICNHDVSYVSPQLMVVTQSGAVGVAVANHVTEELSDEFVTVPTRHQHMAGEVAGDWGGVRNDKHAIRINALVIS